MTDHRKAGGAFSALPLALPSVHLYLQTLRRHTNTFVILRPGRCAKYCDQHDCVCLSVCSRTYLRNRTCKLRQIFCACSSWL